jgi:hypothetical protein
METSRMQTNGTRSIVDRMAGAARLDVDVYEEVEADVTATNQAFAVVAMVAVAQAIGASGQGLIGIIVSVLVATVGWLLWAGITYLIGDKLLGGTATWGELLRTLGFAQSPGLLYVFGIIPLLGGMVRLVVAIWILIAGIIAIRQALDFGTGRAILTAVLGWLVVAIPMAILAAGHALFR